MRVNSGNFDSFCYKNWLINGMGSLLADCLKSILIKSDFVE